MGHAERLVRRTRRRLFAVTLGLLALLVVGVGSATAVMGLAVLDADVDHALRSAVAAQAAGLTAESFGTDGGEATNGEDGTQTPEIDDRPPAAADTFLLVLDAKGRIVLNPSGRTIAGLPDAKVVTSTTTTGEDLRTIEAGGHSFRLLTVPVIRNGTTVGFVQGAFVLDLHDSQSQSLVLAIVLVGAMGLVAAALITLLVSDRALGPIREGFAAQRRFVADASHELRTPAALIRANAEVLQRENLVDPDGAPLLADIVGEADRLGGLVGDLLQLSSWDEMRTTLSPMAVDVAAIARDTVRGAAAMAAERGVPLILDVGDGAAWSMADPERIVQVLLVLIDNAVDHSPAGAPVTVRVRSSGRSVTIDVEDGGPGIPAAELERIFQPFTRLPGSSRRSSGGTGLGLAIARRIVVAHGGSIEASSPAGGGARFTVILGALAPTGLAGRSADGKSHSALTR
jgi:signal transduction histidine kinase